MPGAAPFSNIAPFTNTPAPGPFNNVGMDQQSLLRWGIEHSAPGALRASAEAIQAGKRSDLNTDVLKAIMGTSDADRMTECVMVTQGKWVDREPNGKKPEGWKPSTDADVTKEDRIRAWGDLEMLIEDLDNANDLKFLKLWEPIFKSCSDEDDDVAMRACWVCGTAVQNNPKAQDAFLELDPLPTMCSIIMSTDVSASVRSKAMYCLSSTLKHSEAAVTRFTEIDGWKVLNQSLQDSSLTVRTKTAFLLSQLVSQSTTPSALLTSLRSSSILSSLISSLLPSSSMPTGPSGDIEAIDLDYREKSLRVIVNVVEAAGTELLAEEKSQIKSVVENVESESDWETQVEEMGLAKEEWESFRSKIGSTE